MTGCRDGIEQAIARSLVQHRCFGCGGVLVVFHICSCCAQLVHPGCECAARWTRGARLVGADGMLMELQGEEGSRWQSNGR